MKEFLKELVFEVLAPAVLLLVLAFVVAGLVSVVGGSDWWVA